MKFLKPIPDEVIDTLIKPPREIFTGCDDALRVRTEKRRLAANGLRQRAQRVETGAPVSDVLRMINRKEA